VTDVFLAASFLDVFGSEAFWESAIRLGGPLMLATLGCLICSRAGVLFVGVEGAMLIGAFFAVAGAIWTGSAAVGVLLAMAAGVVVALLFGVFSINLRMGDVVGGLVVWIAGTGVASFLQQEWFPTGTYLGDIRLEAAWGSTGSGVADIFFHQHLLIYLAIVSAFAIAVFLKTKPGIILRSSGESIRAAQSFGVPLRTVRFAALAVGGALTGLAGATLSLAVAGGFTDSIVGGRGFVALACVMVGMWKPIPALIAAAVFGLADAYSLQADVGPLDGWIGILPYVLVLVVIAVLRAKGQGPAEEGRGLPEQAA